MRGSDVAGQGMTVLVCTGSTGGHFFPALAFAESVQENHPKVAVHFILTKSVPFAQRALMDRRITSSSISFLPPSDLFSYRFLFALFKCMVAFLKSAGLVWKLKPCLVVGFGSYASIPAVLIASLFGLPVLLHEQNVVPGRANLFLSVWASRIAVSFQETLNYFPKEKTCVSGYPLRKSFEGLSDKPKPADGSRPLTLLIFGGSQGARSINEVFLEAMSMLSSEERLKFAVIHITGSNRTAQLQTAYRGLSMKSDIVEFTDRMWEFLSLSDLVIARAGAGTIFELAQLRRASILIPYPFAHRHQEWNGRYLAACGAARVILERELTPKGLKDAVMELAFNAQDRNLMGQAIGRFSKPNVAETLAESAWSLCDAKVR